MVDRDEPHDDDAPSLRQRLHQATGDWDREAQALVDRADDDIDAEAAQVAVRRASGDFGADVPASDDEMASPEDAKEVEEERES